METANAAAADQRLFSQPRHVQGEVEPITTLILYIHSFFNSVTTLVEHRRELSLEYQCPDFKQLADAIVRALENLADALQQGQQPCSLPAFDPYLQAIHDHIEQLHANRTSEFAAAPSQVTPKGKPFENALPFLPYWLELPQKSPVFMLRSSACKNEFTLAVILTPRQRRNI